ncbi:MAG TPA: PTS sugar transporter subunit IIA [Polyangiaceae bacterium]|nr:PTS sugar transporter subunit IIA [Polyangiaceae bacterium]
MRLIELLTQERVVIRHNEDGERSIDKAGVLHVLAQALATGARVDAAQVERVLSERERLQSTGIGEGVAIPHGALAQLQTQYAALLIVPEGVDFAAIDAMKVTILFAVIGPKRATGEHLKTLARVSRLLRNKGFRDRLVAAPDANEAYALIVAEEGQRQ